MSAIATARQVQISSREAGEDRDGWNQTKSGHMKRLAGKRDSTATARTLERCHSYRHLHCGIIGVLPCGVSRVGQAMPSFF